MNWRATVMGVVAMVCAPVAWAQRPPETHPVSEQRDIVMTWDRSAMPVDIELWAEKTVLAYDASSSAYPYATAHLTCTSNADTSKGRCPVVGQENLSGAGTITLLMTEQRSGSRTEISISGYLQRPMSGQICTTDYWAQIHRPLWTTRLERCGRDSSAGIGVALTISDSELTRLVAGRWKGELLLQLANIAGGTTVATYEFSLDFTVTDHNAAAIYLPEFGHATPTVGLNLRYDPFAHTLSGSKLVDVCLYDGLGSQSQYLGLTVRDTSGHAPGPTGFSVWHDDGGTDARRRLDYTLTLDHAGTRVPLVNGQEHQLRNIDSVPLRLVMLPGMTYPVYCVPTPITFVTPMVPSTSKDAGHYGGTLHVELRIPTTSP